MKQTDTGMRKFILVPLLFVAAALKVVPRLIDAIMDAKMRTMRRARKKINHPEIYDAPAR